MAIRVGAFRPPQEAVSIVDGRTQVQFDYPEDFARWLRQHPEEDISKFSWYTGEISGGH